MPRSTFPRRSLWHWYRSQSRTHQILLASSITLLVFLLCLGFGALIIHSTQTTSHTLNNGPAPTATPTFASGLPGSIPVTPLPTVIATQGVAPTVTPIVTATVTSTATAGATTPTIGATATTTTTPATATVTAGTTPTTTITP